MGAGINKCTSVTFGNDSALAKSLGTRMSLDSIGNEAGGEDAGNATSRSGILAKNQKVFNVARVADEASELRKLQDRLVQASRAGDFKKVVDAVAEGADVHSKTLRGQSPLMLASGSHSKGAKESVSFLVDTMADIEAKDESGWTPLLHACRNNQQEIVSYLLETNASLKARTNDGKTAVMLAAMDSADSLVISLVQRKAQIDKKDERGWSVLFFACEDGRHDLVKWLLKKQANARDKSKDNTTPLMVAAENGSKKIGQKLAKKNGNINARNVQGNTALMISLRAQKEEFAEWLLEEGADVTARNGDDEDALDIADMLGMHSIKNKLEMKARLASEEVVAQNTAAGMF
mmetsp:Transcript_122347/g.228649  ORF Transcript_122347/g.228649 Transcript_122347/m.228649 type:complete len:348 (+) Transcript_122347:96-1139(+)